MSSALRRAGILVGRVAGGILRPGRLSTVVLFVTPDCNARCPDCFNADLPHLRGDRSPGGRAPLTLAEYGLIAARAAPLAQVILSGGEPFLRGDVDGIVSAFYRRAGARLFSLPTNGSLPSRACRAVERMAVLCPDATINLIVSLDAVGPRHDGLRRLPGLFEKALSLCRAALALKSRRGNVNLIVSTAVTERNAEDAAALIPFLRGALPPGVWHHNIQYDQRLGSPLARDPALRRKVLALERLASDGRAGGPWSRLIGRWYVGWINALILHQLDRGEMVYRCASGRRLAVITHDGAAAPCEPFLFEDRYRDFPRFDLRRYGYDFAAVRREPAFARLLRYIDDGRCAACPWSCAAIASMAYDIRNWPLLLRVR